MAKTTKKSRVHVRKTGVEACPLDEGFVSVLNHFHLEVPDPEVSELLKEYVVSSYSKDDAKLILSSPEYKFSMFSAYGAAIHWMNNSQDFPEKYQGYPSRIREYTDALLKEARASVSNAHTKPVKRLSVVELMARKVNSTIMVDIDEMEDEWIEGKKTKRDMYNLFKAHDLKGAAVPMVETRLSMTLMGYTDARDKTCECAIEAYSHLTGKELNRRISALEEMLEDLNRVRASSQAKRTIRKKRPVSADKQIKNLVYLKESSEFKVESINPALMVGAFRLYTFNEKTRTLTEFVADGPSGLSIKGTTLYGFSEDLSRSTRLRKPLDILPEILSKTPRQINTLWKGLTTKTTTPTGRINSDTVLLRSLTK